MSPSSRTFRIVAKLSAVFGFTVLSTTDKKSSGDMYTSSSRLPSDGFLAVLSAAGLNMSSTEDLVALITGFSNPPMICSPPNLGSDPTLAGIAFGLPIGALPAFSPSFFSSFHSCPRSLRAAFACSATSGYLTRLSSALSHFSRTLWKFVSCKDLRCAARAASSVPPAFSNLAAISSAVPCFPIKASRFILASTTSLVALFQAIGFFLPLIFFSFFSALDTPE